MDWHLENFVTPKRIIIKNVYLLKSNLLENLITLQKDKAFLLEWNDFTLYIFKEV